MNKRDLLFIDVETTHLDVTAGEIIEIAWARTTPNAETVKETYLARLMPQHLETAHPKALEVNGFTEEKWRASPLTAHADVQRELKRVAADTILVGHNISFDETFLAAFLGEKPWHYHKVDTAALAWPLFASGKLAGLKLEMLCEFLGIAQTRKHSADEDVQSCYKAYRALMARYATL